MTYGSVLVVPYPEAEKERPTSYRRLFFLTFIVVLPTLLSGIETCYSSIALPQMSLTVVEASWFAAGPGLSAAVGSLFMGCILDVFGRKISLTLCSLFHVVGWLLIYSDRSFAVVFGGRLLTGFPATFVCYAGQVYIVECLTVNDEHLRDTMRTWPSIAFAVGQLLTFLLGAVLTHLLFAAFLALLSTAVLVLTFFYVVESPGWLYMAGRIDDAQEASQRLRIHQPYLRDERVVVAGVGAGANADAKRASRCAPAVDRLYRASESNVSLIVAKLRQQNVYKPLLIMMAVCMLSLFTGGMALNSYMINIIDASPPGLTQPAEAANGTTAAANATSTANVVVNVNAFYYSVVSGLLMVTGTILLSFALPRFGARKLTIGSAGCLCVGMLLIGVTNDRPHPSDLLVLRLLSVWLVSFIYSFGIVTIPFSILGEMFPLDAKGFASFALLVQILSAFLVSETYPFLYLLSRSGVFYGYAAMSVAYAFVVFFFMPETVGRDYEQISSSF